MMMAAFQNIVGQRFGRLLATAYAETARTDTHDSLFFARAAKRGSLLHAR